MPEEGKLSSRLKSAFILIVVVLIFLSYTHFTPTKGNELEIPDGVMNFYKNISGDKEYYRIEDQVFAPFGFSPIIHKHGILNGGNYLAAPKYHFYFWSSAWKLLNSKPAEYNFAGLYGALSIKYLFFKNKVEIPYLKEIKKSIFYHEYLRYYIYENEKFLDYVRLVPNLLVVEGDRAEYIEKFYKILKNKIIPFDKLAFVHSKELQQEETNLKEVINSEVDLLKKEPGYLKINVNGIDKKTYLIIAESYHPYWKAKQNGKELKIYEGVPSTLIIPVEEDGVTEIKFTPPKIRFILFLLSSLIIIGLIGIIIYDIRKK